MRTNSVFTLLEVLLVVTIIGILAAITVSGLGLASRRAGEADTRATMARLKNALDQHHNDWGFYPEHDGEFNLADFDFEDRNGNPYLGDDELINNQVVDGFNQPFHYRSPGNHNRQTYDLWSTGHDRTSGTEADITNWQR